MLEAILALLPINMMSNLAMSLMDFESMNRQRRHTTKNSGTSDAETLKGSMYLTTACEVKWDKLMKNLPTPLLPMICPLSKSNNFVDQPLPSGLQLHYRPKMRQIFCSTCPKKRTRWTHIIHFEPAHPSHNVGQPSVEEAWRNPVQEGFSPFSANKPIGRKAYCGLS